MSKITILSEIKRDKPFNEKLPKINSKEFDKVIHKKYLSHLDINNLKGMEIEFIYEWKEGESLIVDRSHIHCSSSRIDKIKLGLTTFTKK